MAYNSNIPLPTDKISNSQADILGNFVALAPWGNGYGQFTLQGTTPTFAAGVNGMYTELYGTTATNELFIHTQSVGIPADVPFTASKMSDNAAVSCLNGWSYLPSGMLIKWGSVAITDANPLSIDVTTQSGGPAFNTAFIPLVTAVNLGSNVDAVSIVVSDFDNVTGALEVYAINASADTFVNYLVMGV